MPGLDANVKLLLHCNGADTSTTFTDESASAHTVTPHADAQIDTDQSVFGGASALFDGSGDYLSIQDSDDWYFANGDFTIDFWVRFNSSSGGQGLIDQYWSSRSWVLGIGGGGSLYFGYSLDGSGYNNTDTGWNPSINTWYHIAYVRYGNFLRLYVDGVQQGSDVDIGTNSLYNSTVELWVGCHHTGSGGNTPGSFLNGRIDELRISKGIARWSSNFTPPTEEYAEISDETLDTNESISVSDSLEAHTNPEQENINENIVQNLLYLMKLQR
jgi:hypothetical protein